MMVRDKIAAFSEIHIKHINALCGQDVKCLNVKFGGLFMGHSTLKD
jgi:hypothetical protein